MLKECSPEPQRLGLRVSYPRALLVWVQGHWKGPLASREVKLVSVGEELLVRFSLVRRW